MFRLTIIEVLYIKVSEAVQYILHAHLNAVSIVFLTLERRCLFFSFRSAKSNPADIEVD